MFFISYGFPTNMYHSWNRGIKRMRKKWPIGLFTANYFLSLFVILHSVMFLEHPEILNTRPTPGDVAIFLTQQSD